MKSLGSFRLGRRTIYVLPWRSVLYGAVSLGVVFLLLLAVDRLVLGPLEREGWTAGELWQRHNKRIEENHRRKTDGNSLAVRAWAGEPPPNRPRRPRTILVMGDSFVWGAPYLTLNHSWWRQLGIELERRGYQEVEVAAAGHPGWSTRQELECARQLIADARPGLVIWGYVTNDPDEYLVPQISRAIDRNPVPGRVRGPLHRLLPNAMFKFEALRARKLEACYAGPEHGYTYHEWEMKLLEGENFQRYRQTVAEVGRFAKSAAVPMFLLTLPNVPSRSHFGPRYAPVLPLWNDAGLPTFNTLEEFVGRYGDIPGTGPEAVAWGINPADGHPGPRAARFHAVMAADVLEKHWPGALGPKSPGSERHELAVNDWLPFDLNVRPSGGGGFLLDYPASAEWMPVMPLDEPTALVALRFPLPVREVRLEGRGLAAARAWVSALDPVEQYDDGVWHDLGRRSGRAVAWQLPDGVASRGLSVVRFSAETVGEDRELRFSLVRAGAEGGGR